MELDLGNKGFCIFGLPDSGKSTLAHYILNQYGAVAFVFDTLHEYPDSPFDSYCPEDRYSPVELDMVIRITMKRYKLIIIDEANRFCPPKPAPLPKAVADLNDWRAHYGATVGYIARRPVQLNPDLTELSQYLFIFQLDGKNDGNYLNDLCNGLGDSASQLPEFHFILYHKGHGFQIYSPIPRTFVTAKKISA